MFFLMGDIKHNLGDAWPADKLASTSGGRHQVSRQACAPVRFLGAPARGYESQHARRRKAEVVALAQHPPDFAQPSPALLCQWA